MPARYCKRSWRSRLISASTSHGARSRPRPAYVAIRRAADSSVTWLRDVTHLGALPAIVSRSPPRRSVASPRVPSPPGRSPPRAGRDSRASYRETPDANVAISALHRGFVGFVERHPLRNHAARLQVFPHELEILERIERRRAAHPRMDGIRRDDVERFVVVCRKCRASSNTTSTRGSSKT